MRPRSAIESELFAAESRGPKIDSLGDPLVKISRVVDFAAFASEVDRVVPRIISAKGGRPPFPTETMVRILVLKRTHNLSDEQVGFQLLDRLSYQRFCGLTMRPAFRIVRRCGTSRIVLVRLGPKPFSIV